MDGRIGSKIFVLGLIVILGVSFLIVPPLVDKLGYLPFKAEESNDTPTYQIRQLNISTERLNDIKVENEHFYKLTEGLREYITGVHLEQYDLNHRIVAESTFLDVRLDDQYFPTPRSIVAANENNVVSVGWGDTSIATTNDMVGQTLNLTVPIYIHDLNEEEIVIVNLTRSGIVPQFASWIENRYDLRAGVILDETLFVPAIIQEQTGYHNETSDINEIFALIEININTGLGDITIFDAYEGMIHRRDYLEYQVYRITEFIDEIITILITSVVQLENTPTDQYTITSYELHFNQRTKEFTRSADEPSKLIACDLLCKFYVSSSGDILRILGEEFEVENNGSSSIVYMYSIEFTAQSSYSWTINSTQQLHYLEPLNKQEKSILLFSYPTNSFPQELQIPQIFIMQLGQEEALEIDITDYVNDRFNLILYTFRYDDSTMGIILESELSARHLILLIKVLDQESADQKFLRLAASISIPVSLFLMLSLIVKRLNRAPDQNSDLSTYPIYKDE